MTHALRLLAAGSAALALSGCASIFNGTTQAVTIRSVPDSAFVTVSNQAGEKVHAGSTPATVTLRRGAGYFRPETYTVLLQKDGFASQEVKVHGTMSAWYIGNILFGGLIGMLAVDPVTGAMYTFPESVTATLAPQTTGSRGGPALTIVSTESLTPEQMRGAIRVATGPATP